MAKLGAQFPEKPSLPADLGGFLFPAIRGSAWEWRWRGDRKIYLIMKNRQLLYDDGLVKSFDDQA